MPFTDESLGNVSSGFLGVAHACPFLLDRLVTFYSIFCCHSFVTYVLAINSIITYQRVSLPRGLAQAFLVF